MLQMADTDNIYYDTPWEFTSMAAKVLNGDRKSIATHSNLVIEKSGNVSQNRRRNTTSPENERVKTPQSPCGIQAKLKQMHQKKENKWEKRTQCEDRRPASEYDAPWDLQKTTQRIESGLFESRIQKAASMTESFYDPVANEEPVAAPRKHPPRLQIEASQVNSTNRINNPESAMITNLRSSQMHNSKIPILPITTPKRAALRTTHKLHSLPESNEIIHQAKNRSKSSQRVPSISEEPVNYDKVAEAQEYYYDMPSDQKDKMNTLDCQQTGACNNQPQLTKKCQRTHQHTCSKGRSKNHGEHKFHASTNQAQQVELAQSTSNHSMTHAVSDSLRRQSWYHGAITRCEAESRLQFQTEGTFLVRICESNRQEFALSVKATDGSVMHMKIQPATGSKHKLTWVLGYFSQPFTRISDMIEYYSVTKLPIKGAEHLCLKLPLNVKHYQ